MRVEPFEVGVDEAALEDLRGRLRGTRWPAEVPGSAWLYGVDLAFLQSLCGYWADGFDWPAAVGRLNAFPQFRAEIGAWNGERLGIHFIHRRSSRAGARPLLIQHGWPSSVFEFHKIIDLLAEPDDADAPAFHVVAPSLPGYGWSEIPRRGGIGTAAIADMWAELMAGLGYGRFLYHGGDWGAGVGGQLGLRHPDRLEALHLTAAALAPPGDAARPQTAEEREFFEREQRPYVEQDAAHRGIHGTKFQSLSYPLADSPAGLAAWIADKWWMLSDCLPEAEKRRPVADRRRVGDVLKRFTMDELLTTASIYWFTGTINSSMRIYHEAMRAPAEVEAEVGGQVRLREGERIEVPTGFAKPVRGTPLPPRSYCERAFNIQHWTEFPEGGHFPALEVPALLLRDLRVAFGPRGIAERAKTDA